MKNYRNMSKIELQSLKDLYSHYINDIDIELDRRGMELTLHDAAAPFRSWSLEEKNTLYYINQSAFEYFSNGNYDKTIDDYNLMQLAEGKITYSER